MASGQWMVARAESAIDAAPQPEDSHLVPGTHIHLEPVLQRVSFLAGRKHVDTLANFAEGHHAQEEALFPGLAEESHPRASGVSRVSSDGTLVRTR